jgi:hypothetical protein
MDNEAKTKSNRIMLVLIVVVLGLVYVASAASGGDSARAPRWERSESTERIMPAIESTTDCSKLQIQFDQAEMAHSNALDQGDVDLAQEYTRAMGHADDQMAAVGCYD